MGTQRTGAPTSAKRIGQPRIGISGWTYAPWRGTFYPEDLPHKRELEYASKCFNSIEINGTFYSLQRPASFRAWHDATPGGFVFSVKGGRFITHLKRLKDVEIPLANFWASGVLLLGEKLGPVLWQLPPTFRFDEAKLDAFLALLPRDTHAAARQARRHDARMKGRAWVKADERPRRPLRHALEIRHDTFRDERFVELLRRHHVALVVADTAGKWPLLEDLTADFVYVRLHGDEELYVSGYTDDALEHWAGRVRAWLAGRDPPGAERVGPKQKAGAPRDVYVYFDNDVKVRAPFDARSLAWRVAGRKGQPPALPDLAHVTEEARTSWPAYRRVVKQGN